MPSTIASTPASGWTSGRAIAVRLRHVGKEYATPHGTVAAVTDLELDVYDGEFLTLLGPSGSGKTTTLRLIAGFELPTAGTIELAGADVTATPPFRRDVNTVFQDYALFPHMSVLQNVEYGLRVKGVAGPQRRRRARAALDTVRLSGFDDRRPAQLSGGQRQRVALARALVNRPKVLLLDEPLGALDLKLREQMQVELKGIQREVGITFVFVTHDQDEALTMSDRVAVFHEGRIEQVGTPLEVYDHPSTAFVAGFVGTSNLLEGADARAALGQDGAFIVRPEKITMADPDTTPPPGRSAVGGLLSDVVYAGSVTRFVVALDSGGSLLIARPNTGDGRPTPRPGSRVLLHWASSAAFPVAPSPTATGAGDEISPSRTSRDPIEPPIATVLGEVPRPASGHRPDER
jgi:putative spermidine/putrescine transport system ATP-binding protein